MNRLLVLLLLQLFPLLNVESQDRPNIVWFVSEDNSPFLGAYGNDLVYTPHLDSFINNGIKYTNAFANAPVCAPSRSTIITGVLPLSMGSQHMRSLVDIDPQIKFFPQYLKEAGYFNTLRLKRDYNLANQEGTWDVDDWWHLEDALMGREAGQPFFMFYNTWMSHEGELHNYEEKQYRYFKNTFERLPEDSLKAMLNRVVRISPAEVKLPNYLPDLPEVRRDLARYHEIMQLLDLEFAALMRELTERDLLKNTIVIYSSDHGGVLGRSKRFPLESGLRVPLAIQFPEAYRSMAPTAAGTEIDRVVSFLDMAPTILSLAGVPVPEYMQGENFLVPEINEDPFALGFRGRMDETYDMVRTIRDKRYRYVRNYNPHRPAGQRINFLWRAPNVRAWEAAYQKGNLYPVQSAFFRPKTAEELYDCWEDPDNVRNLAKDPGKRKILRRMRKAQQVRLLKLRDTGFIPEGELFAATEKTEHTYATYTASQPLKKIMKAAETVTQECNTGTLVKYLRSKVPAIRYWGAVGALINKGQDSNLVAALRIALDDPSGDVRATAAEALYLRGHKDMAKAAFASLLRDDNPFVALRAANALEATGARSSAIDERVFALAAMEEKGRFNYPVRKCRYLSELYRR
ncbi:sulfatase-like hydrolase/transferase [Lewinella sp. W8]|uniref:sulfatase-like hydrolase/transferase n=1 Tax=Lewinella sp. W8 TaxID=2528208 RepID=UPI0010686184|nr:sulfatase-like hydrolase/transferase [Lewinella sp. W8]MTB53842.1 sulfatase-like hydrolase/transferase [Lewinella sp. W8]